MFIVMLGIDLAKNVFALHGLNETGGVDLKLPAVARGKLRPRCPA
jgi:transposase